MEKSKKKLKVSNVFVSTQGAIAMIYAVCQDGTLWVTRDNETWEEITPVIEFEPRAPRYLGEIDL